ncbi:hypothetical protein MTR_4g077947 [Medicago truncatula]|uniref:Uncharacterized protein n=1 Tax=Medicago truncatula TaxID=3880 RepID=A0A072ULL7_MEDTR|nr:hypothetical protein MTR_4g077947 [Medicago truncatula]
MFQSLLSKRKRGAARPPQKLTRCELSIASSTSDDGSEMRAKGGCDWKGASD